MDTVGKKWYLSKTVWVNVIAVGGIILQTQTGFIMTPELQALTLSLINLWLRAVTKEEIVF